jgi:hypothetical protein
MPACYRRPAGTPHDEQIWRRSGKREQGCRKSRRRRVAMARTENLEEGGNAGATVTIAPDEQFCR